MPEKKYTFRRLLLSLLRYWWLLAIVGGLIAAAVLFRAVRQNPPVKLHVTRSTRIDITPEEITAIRRIGQWEFLSVATEEMVEWHEHGTFSNRHLVRIYSGTLRLGVDLSRASDDWFTSLPDSVAKLVLPPVGLLDEQFIDEAATRSFYEKGTIPAAVRDSLYVRAADAMKKRCLTEENLQTTETAAREHFTTLFRNLGFRKVEIIFRKSS